MFKSLVIDCCTMLAVSFLLRNLFYTCPIQFYVHSKVFSNCYSHVILGIVA